MQQAEIVGKEKYRALLARGEFCLPVGPYVYRLKSSEPLVAQGLAQLYADYEVTRDEAFCDHHLTIEPFNLLNRFTRRYLRFRYDHTLPFDPVPKKQCYAFLEWGLNWCVSVYANEYLKIHAAVVEKNGLAMVLPGLPGAGKSTLSAALTLTGWRLLSDEHALIPHHSTQAVPLCRPVSLKNESIEVIRNFSDRAVFGPVSEETHKGRVIHMKADLSERSHDPHPVPVRWLLFPKYEAGAALDFRRKGKAESFMFVALHSFNYSLLGLTGFETMSGLIDAVDCYDLVYSDLDDALKTIEKLTSGHL